LLRIFFQYSDVFTPSDSRFSNIVQTIHQWKYDLLYMHKSQFHKMDTYDWFCAHMLRHDFTHYYNPYFIIWVKYDTWSSSVFLRTGSACVCVEWHVLSPSVSTHTCPVHTRPPISRRTPGVQEPGPWAPAGLLLPACPCLESARCFSPCSVCWLCVWTQMMTVRCHMTSNSITCQN